MKYTKLLSILACSSFLATAAAGSAFADESDEFSKIMMEGIAHYKKGSSDPNEFKEAIKSFEKAKKINPIPDVIYNIARSYQLLGDCDQALSNYREYALTSAENAESVKDHIATLSAECGVKTGSLTMRCTPADTKVVIDYDDPVECNNTYELKVGDHELKFMAQNYEPQTRSVEIKKDAPKSIVIDLEPTASAAGTQAANSDGAESQEIASTTADDSKETTSTGISLSDTSTLFWAGVGTAGGGLLFSIIGVSMVATSHRETTYNNWRAYERSTSKLVGGSVMSAIGIAAMTAGAVILVIDHFKPKDDSQAFSIQPAISVTPESASAGITMTF